jgi:hypothetical protein
MIAFIGSAVATAEHQSPSFPNYSWFAVAYMLCLIIGIFIVIASDSVQTYYVALVGYLACGLVLTSSSVNSLVYSPHGTREATAAGHILLSMVNVCLSILITDYITNTSSDRLDLLFWFCTFSRATSLPRLLCPRKGSPTCPKQSYKWLQHWPSRHDQFLQWPTADVYLRATRRF